MKELMLVSMVEKAIVVLKVVCSKSSPDVESRPKLQKEKP